MTLARKFSKLAEQLQQDGTATEKLFRIAQRGSHSLHLSPALSFESCAVVEIGHAPPITRGLSDLVVRRVEEGDVAAVAALDTRPLALFQGRLDRGDFLYLAELDGQVVGHTCLHRGPKPFSDERGIFTDWSLEDAATFWSYDASIALPLRTAGVGAKLFQLSLRDIFDVHGAKRVRGFIHDWNEPSLSLHERLGFSTVGRITAVALVGLKWVRWEAGGRTHQWLLPRNSEFALPPVVT
jgi:RimJ/RimL family protein N-acetyltransferase